MVGGIDRINAESPESNANSLLRSLFFGAKPHLSRGASPVLRAWPRLPGKEKPIVRPCWLDTVQLLGRIRLRGPPTFSLVRRIRKAEARVVQNSLVIDFPRAVIFKIRRYKREGCCFAAVRESVVGTFRTCCHGRLMSV